jgi:uncharacterized protein YndB with AHSA1/START domain
MANGFELSDVIPTTPKVVYDAWMSSTGHTAMTGSPAIVDPHIGGAFEAWDGYIVGRTLSLEPGHRIVEVVLDPIEEGTRITIRHTEVPDGHLSYELDVWQEHYFDPMRKYFSASGGL